MKGTRIVYVALVLCLAPCGAPGASAAQAQEPPRAAVTLALDEAIQQAVERHLDLHAADARVVAAEGLRQQAALRPNPRLTFQVENLRGDRSAPFSYARDADTFFYGSQLIETGGSAGGARRSSSPRRTRGRSSAISARRTWRHAWAMPTGWPPAPPASAPCSTPAARRSIASCSTTATA